MKECRITEQIQRNYVGPDYSDLIRGELDNAGFDRNKEISIRRDYETNDIICTQEDD